MRTGLLQACWLPPRGTFRYDWGGARRSVGWVAGGAYCPARRDVRGVGDEIIIEPVGPRCSSALRVVFL